MSSLAELSKGNGAINGGIMWTFDKFQLGSVIVGTAFEPGRNIASTRPLIYWEQQISNTPRPLQQGLNLLDIEKCYQTSCSTLLARAEDKKSYFVKCLGNGSKLAVEWIVSRLGHAMNAPVPRTAIISIGPEDIRDFRYLLKDAVHIEGPAFGSEAMDNVKPLNLGESNYPYTEVNHRRLAIVAALFGLTNAQDRQLLQRKSAPYEISAIDFGEFLAGGRTCVEAINAVRRDSHVVEPDRLLWKWSQVHPDHFSNAISSVELISDNTIATIVAEVPDAWISDPSSRIVFADTIAARRDALIQWRQLGGWAR